MEPLEDRLVECFSAVFPKRSREEILVANQTSFAEWDSLAGVTLLTLLQEEFKIEVDLMDLGDLGSYAAVRRYVAGLVDQGRGLAG
jgi:acyl carrier protein